MNPKIDGLSEGDHRKSGAIPFDRNQFLLKTNASLKRIERGSLLLLLIGGGLGFFVSKIVGLSLVLGGVLAMLHFRSLHRLFQMRVLNPAGWLKTKFIYSVTLFFMICFFFWVIQSKEVNSTSVVAGFVLMTGSIFFDTSRQSRSIS